MITAIADRTEEHPDDTQVFVASTIYGLATLVAGIESGAFRTAQRRILVLSNNSLTPEVAHPLQSFDGFAALAAHFNEVHDYNEAIAPQHPAEFRPSTIDQVIWERYFRLLWDLGDSQVHLVCESIQAAPALTLAQVFADASLEVYADGLMSYGPTRSRIAPQVTARIRRLLYLDLVPGLVPLLLSERGIESEQIDAGAFRAVLGVLAENATVPEPPEVDVALIIGQYFSALSILTEEEEIDLHLRMLRHTASLGHTDIVFKPHPSATGDQLGTMAEEAEGLGVRLRVLDAPVLAEVLFEQWPIVLVVGCFSTALMTAARLYELPTARLGTDLLLERLKPYENSNRIPAAIVDALLPNLAQPTTLANPTLPSAERIDQRLTPLVRAVGYAMQSQLYPHLRAEAEEFLAVHYPANAHYFKRRRLTKLNLPGALGGRSSSVLYPIVRKAVHTARGARASRRKTG
ncbi:MAG: polysialyltransferase family glycosyltransferase [Propionibacteriaceae bacterium]